MGRRQLSKSEIRELGEQLKACGIDVITKQEVILQDRVYFVNHKPWLFSHEAAILPTLHLLLIRNVLPSVTVDMGAVRFVAKGADIMRPGVTAAEPFSKDAVVVIIDQNNHKPLAVAKALFSSDELLAQSQGKVARNLHYVGDAIWRAQLDGS